MRSQSSRGVFLAVALLASQVVQAAGDACAIQPGRWTLSYGQKYKNQSAASQFNFKISAHFYGDVTFEAACDGGAKVISSTAAEFDVDAALALPGNAGQTASCEIPMQVTFTGLHFAAGAQANRPSASATVSITRAAGGKGCYGDPALLGAAISEPELSPILSGFAAHCDPTLQRDFGSAIVA